jgi:hypothetical protein
MLLGSSVVGLTAFPFGDTLVVDIVVGSSQTLALAGGGLSLWGTGLLRQRGESGFQGAANELALCHLVFGRGETKAFGQGAFDPNVLFTLARML